MPLLKTLKEKSAKFMNIMLSDRIIQTQKNLHQGYIDTYR